MMFSNRYYEVGETKARFLYASMPCHALPQSIGSTVLRLGDGKGAGDDGGGGPVDGARVGDDDVVVAGLDAPAVALLVPVGGGVALELGDADAARLAGRQVERLGEAAQLLDGAVDARGGPGPHVQLRHLGAGAGARVGDAVADVDVLAVEGAAGLGAEVEERGHVLQAAGEAEGELARGVGVAKEHVGDGVAGLVAAVPGLDDGARVGEPRHLLGRARLHHHGRVGVGGDDGGDEPVERSGQPHALAVGALGLPVRVEARAHHHLVVLRREGRRPRNLVVVVDDLAPADAQGSVLGRARVAAELRRRRRPELDAEPVRLALGHGHAPALLARRLAEEAVARDLRRGVVDDELVVDEDLGRAAHDAAHLVRAVLVGHDVALHVGPPQLPDVGDVVVDEVHLRLGKVQLVGGLAAARGPARLVVHGPPHAGPAVGRRGLRAEQRQEAVRVRADGVGRLCAELLGDAVVRRHGVVGGERGRAAAVVGGGLGVGADDERLLVLAKGQDAAVILEQDGALGGDPAQEGGRLGGVGLALGAVLLDLERGALLDELEDLAGAVVDDVGKGLVVGGVELEGLAAEAGRAGHLEVEAGDDGGRGAVGAEPVAHDEAVPAPLLAQHGVEVLGVLAAHGAVDAVVGRHEGAGAGVADGELEGQGVDLAQGALGDDGLDAHALVLLVVAEEVLDGGLDAGALDTADEGGGAEAGQEGVLADGLEAAAAEGRALHVDGRAKDDVGALRDGFGAHGPAGLFEQLLVEGGAQGGAAREAGGRHAVEELCAADAVGAVGQAQRGHAMLRQGLCVPKVDACSLTGQEVNLFGKAEVLENLVDVNGGFRYESGTTTFILQPAGGEEACMHPESADDHKRGRGRVK
ncbi:cell wall protein [Purpureocillium lavendulum]|uniref:Cell wall protein n=1 Tax=Purpureocillium lavendulum TaxID=1247861 RepID=A0AB34FXH5_9HYPO|nr:cell wall protein [Purpureocillium lavendulum]